MIGMKNRLKGNIDSKYTELQKYKDKYKGKQCFVVATGPSLNIEDLNKLNKKITFSMNSIVKLMNDNKWNPTFYGIQDKEVYKVFNNEIDRIDKEKSTILISGDISKNKARYKNMVSFPLNCAYHQYEIRKDRFYAKFSDNSYAVVYDGYSITYSLIEIAMYMGFNKIYLLGADCNFLKTGKNHFIEYNLRDRRIETAGKRNLVGYNKIKEEAKKSGVEIFNATRGGSLEVFPRVNLDDIV